MELLRTYLSTLPPEAQADYAARAGTTIGYLRKALSKGQKFDGALARRLDEESDGAVDRRELRPDIWSPHEVIASTKPTASMDEDSRVVPFEAPP